MVQRTRQTESVGLRADRFDEGRGYGIDRAAGTREWLILLTCHGRGLVRGDGGPTRTLARHDVAIFRAGRAHRYETDPKHGRWGLLWAHFTPQPAWDDWFDWPDTLPGVTLLSLRTTRVRQAVRQHLAEAARLHAGVDPYRRELMLSAIGSALLWCHGALPLPRRMQIDPRVQQAMSYVNEHLDGTLAVDTLAEQAKLSASRFSRLFKEQAGCSPQQFVESRRMERAKHLLELGTHPIQQIASMVGYNCPFYFSHRFRKATGVCPSAYRGASTRASGRG